MLKSFKVFLFLVTGLLVSSAVAESGQLQPNSWLEQTAKIRFNKICDGSAAVLLDTKTMLVAYDEKNTLFAYDINGGPPIARFNLSKILDLPTKREIDIEGAVRDKNQIWWLGSHSRNKTGKNRPNRQILFSTNVPDKKLKIIRQPTNLFGALLAHPPLAKILTDAVRAKPPKQGGVSIEGLAKHPAGGLIVGFRSPLTGTNAKAIAVHIAWINGNFQVKKLYRLDLNNRGIRDIVQYRGGFLIIAGSAGQGGKSVLYNWREKTGTTTQISAVFKGMNPEALVRLKRQWLVLSDDGKRKRPDKSAKKKYRKCDSIRKKSGENHSSVYFNGAIFKPAAK